MTKPFIFGIGPAKTGTHSLCAALETLGYTAQHMGKSCGKGMGVGKVLADNLQNNPDDILRNVSGMDALVDWPMPQLFKNLKSQVPHGKFILTYRCPSEAALSWMQMTSKMHRVFKHREPQHAYNSYRRHMEYHIDLYDEVMKEFWGDSSLLVLPIDLPGEKKWTRLCTFLGHSVPDAPFPHEFRGENIKHAK